MTPRDSDGQAGRPAGQITTSTLADGTHAFRLRFRAGDRRERVTLHERRECPCGCGGGWNERTATVELDNILARVRARVWPSRLRAAQAAASADSARVPTFHEYASWWLTAKTEGVIGDKPIDANTQADYRWRLTVHLLPFFGEYRLDEIDRRVCLRFKETKLRESEELRRVIAAGASCATGADGESLPSGWRRSRSSSRRSAAFSTRPSRTSTSSATRRAGAGCASRPPSRRERSSRWTSSLR
jgi:hypothetical protein